MRFSALRADRHTITPRALSLNLKQMIDGNVVSRRLIDGFRPASLHGLALPGQELMLSIR